MITIINMMGLSSSNNKFEDFCSMDKTKLIKFEDLSTLDLTLYETYTNLDIEDQFYVIDIIDQEDKNMLIIQLKNNPGEYLIAKIEKENFDIYLYDNLDLYFISNNIGYNNIKLSVPNEVVRNLKLETF